MRSQDCTNRIVEPEWIWLVQKKNLNICTDYEVEPLVQKKACTSKKAESQLEGKEMQMDIIILLCEM